MNLTKFLPHLEMKLLERSLDYLGGSGNSTPASPNYVRSHRVIIPETKELRG